MRGRSRRSWGSVLALGTVLAAAAAAPAYPPITCGRESVRGKAYVVHTHGPNCSYATHWVREFLVHRRGPSGWKCRGYGAQVPVDCQAGRKRYFFANPAKG
jgi:hypothetical protein